ncbi:DUF2249 domain-containing protein [Ignavibacterium sp.]|uniref:DUF2249 domain-containing protein n=1 Tax=Ignavibacterium sp. TaxID=2651167 RepID=UPI00307FC4DE
MITKDMKVSQVLADYPETINVFLQISPHFKKLNNKVLRKTLASRVTIQQAASIAGVELNKLLYELNKSINKEIQIDNFFQEEKMNQTIEKPEILNSISDDKIIGLDVRPILNSGKDPFLDIMNKVKSLENEQVLMIINSFEPVPLYSVLGNKGFEHWTEKINDEFRVYFFKTNPANKTLNNNVQAEKDLSDFENVIEIDVRELPPPEPMMKIFEKLPEVDDETILLVHHHREPVMLYPKLEERGFEAVSNKIEDNYYKVLIFKKRFN